MIRVNENLSTKDKMTPFLPHKSKVKADNQAIFPIGGGTSRKYILFNRNSEQSSFNKEVAA